VIEAAQSSKSIGDIYGMHYGIEGLTEPQQHSAY
jgi:hypothetical protein